MVWYHSTKVWYPQYFTFNFGENHAFQTFSFFELTFFQCQISFISEMLKCQVFFLFRINIFISQNCIIFSSMIPAMLWTFQVGKDYFPTFKCYLLTMVCTSYSKTLYPYLPLCFLGVLLYYKTIKCFCVSSFNISCYISFISKKVWPVKVLC